MIKFLMGYKTTVASLVFYFVFQFAFAQEYEMLSNGHHILGTYEERTASVAVGDIDGDIDIIVANGRHWPGQNRIFINDARGIFTVEENLGNQRSTSYAVELADFDNDGDLDIAVGNDMAPNYIYINDSKGNFSRSASFGVEYALTRNLNVADFLHQYKKYISQDYVTVVGPHKIFGLEQNDLSLQLRKQKIDKVILAGMSGNLCVEAHMRELLEDGFEVAIVGDATASTILPGLDGNQAAQTNFRMISSHVYKADELNAAIASAKAAGTLSK